MKYNKIQIDYKKNKNKWIEFNRDNFGTVKQANVDLAISKDTRKFFKNIGAKEQIIKEHNRITIISILGNYRTDTIYTKTGE